MIYFIWDINFDYNIRFIIRRYGSKQMYAISENLGHYELHENFFTNSMFKYES